MISFLEPSVRNLHLDLHVVLLVSLEKLAHHSAPLLDSFSGGKGTVG